MPSSATRGQDEGSAQVTTVWLFCRWANFQYAPAAYLKGMPPVEILQTPREELAKA